MGVNNLDTLRISELLCSKICHDLISPISAINNGLEFLDPSDDSLFETSKKLIGESGQQAVDKLSLFRLAFGSVGERENLSWIEINNSLSAYFRHRKINIEFPDHFTDSVFKIPKMAAKVIIFVMLFGADCLPRGGKINVECADFTTLENFHLALNGTGCFLRDDVESGLDILNKTEDLTISNILAFLATLHVDMIGKELKIKDKSDDRMLILVR